ncbi:hypothetical protein VPNG_07674 [Cytospora leucostoma]|uniref:Haloacid dehalogenase, type II n=1 Tax=Cytospora leucostoma TaxID=1230097 RepID=A0A423WF33_9PEZI|nr:hypothetical protein VPNG_07674 [Cytospora leucostoma]
MSTNTTIKNITIAFDLYGTILSTESITEALSAHLGGNTTQAGAVSTKWRRYQLEYTWRMAAMGAYEPFDRVTRAALQHAAAEELGPGGSLPESVVDELMRSYDSLGVFPDVVPALERLRGRKENSSSSGGGGSDNTSDKDTEIKVEAVIFSNGTEAMLRNSIDTSPDLKPFRTDDNNDRGGPGLFKKLITVHDARTYKPTPLSYSHLRSEADADADADADGHGEALVWLVSANPFDVVGARTAGLPAAWIDRAGAGWVDGLGDVIFGVGGGGGGGEVDDAGRQRARPSVIAKGVDEAVEEILRLGT